MSSTQEKEPLVLLVNEDNDENLALIINDLYEEAERSAMTIESCSRYFGWLGWDCQEQKEKADTTLQRAAEAGDEARRGHVAALCEVLESERPILEQYRQLLLTRPPLVMQRLKAQGALTRIARMLERARPYRA
jgi:hypothetical protein